MSCLDWRDSMKGEGPEGRRLIKVCRYCMAVFINTWTPYPQVEHFLREHMDKWCQVDAECDACATELGRS